MIRRLNLLSSFVLPFFLLIALLGVQIALPYCLANNIDSVVMAEEETEVNSVPLLEEMECLHGSNCRALELNKQKSVFSLHHLSLYKNPYILIFSTPPDFLI